MNLKKIKDSILNHRSFIIGNDNDFANACNKVGDITDDALTEITNLIAEAVSNGQISRGDRAIICLADDSSELDDSKFEYLLPIVQSGNNFIKIAICQKKD